MCLPASPHYILSFKYSNIWRWITDLIWANPSRCTVRQIHDLTSNIRIFDLEQTKMPFTAYFFRTNPQTPQFPINWVWKLEICRSIYISYNDFSVTTKRSPSHLMNGDSLTPPSRPYNYHSPSTQQDSLKGWISSQHLWVNRQLLHNRHIWRPLSWSPQLGQLPSSTRAGKSVSLDICNRLCLNIHWQSNAVRQFPWYLALLDRIRSQSNIAAICKNPAWLAFHCLDWEIGLVHLHGYIR